MKDITGEGFEFRESDHKYFLDGKPMSGCTTVLDVIAKPALIQWAANQAVLFLEGWLMGLDSVPWEDEVKDMCKKAKTAYAQKRDKAGEAGTDVHAEIEQLINRMMETNDGYFPEVLIHKDMQVQHFADWAYKNNVKFLESEKKVYSRKYNVAGTLDFKCEINGRIFVGDIKTSSNIYNRIPFAQCAAYQMMEKEMDGHSDVKGRVIINLKKTGIFKESSDVYYSYSYMKDLGLFMAALNIYRNLKLDKKKYG